MKQTSGNKKHNPGTRIKGTRDQVQATKTRNQKLGTRIQESGITDHEMQNMIQVPETGI